MAIMQIKNIEKKLMELFNAKPLSEKELAEVAGFACTQHSECSLDCKKKKRHTKPYWFHEWVEGEPNNTECNFYETEIDLIGSLFG